MNYAATFILMQCHHSLCSYGPGTNCKGIAAKLLGLCHQDRAYFKETAPGHKQRHILGPSVLLLVVESSTAKEEVSSAFGYRHGLALTILF